MIKGIFTIGVELIVLSEWLKKGRNYMTRSLAGKYLPLHNYLKDLSVSHISLSFKEIEAILDAPLPSSARKYQAWWVNSEKAHSYALSWLDAGFLVRNVKFGEYVEFLKIENADHIGIKNIDYKESIKNDLPKNELNRNGLSKEELIYIENISNKMDNVREFLANKEMSELSKENLFGTYETIKNFRKLMGNFDNDVSFLGCLLIKEFLNQRYTINGLNMALKPQGSPGLDVDEITIEGKRVIGELKTTFPYKENDLGASQKINFIKDFEKLHINVADFKYFFVTEYKTFEIVKTKYSQYLQGVCLVLLPQALSSNEFVITY